MGKHWSADAVDQVRGSIKEAIGKITGNSKLEADGASEKVGGKPQTAPVNHEVNVRDPVKK